MGMCKRKVKKKNPGMYRICEYVMCSYNTKCKCIKECFFFFNMKNTGQLGYQVISIKEINIKQHCLSQTLPTAFFYWSKFQLLGRFYITRPIIADSEVVQDCIFIFRVDQPTSKIHKTIVKRFGFFVLRIFWLAVLGSFI